MSDKKDSQPEKNLTQDDADLWEAMTKDVKRLPGKEYKDGVPAEVRKDSSHGGGETIVPEKRASVKTNPQGRELDRRTEERLRKGQMAIEARLDLHGMTQDQAKAALISFIEGASHSGKRCVLVITGKGRTKAKSDEWWENQPGILKQRVPQWFEESSIKPLILKAVPAKQKDGGDGALYVYLRRNRDS
jgi:DNA-nicking Smr family endonuclease